LGVSFAYIVRPEMRVENKKITARVQRGGGALSPGGINVQRKTKSNVEK
jgi:hypothetical protein